MTLLKKLLGSLLACAAILGAAAGSAAASRSETVFFEAPSELLSPVTRPGTIAKLSSLGVSAIRVELHWYSVAPSPQARVRPDFEATNPASYDWGQYVPLLEEAHRRNWKVLLTVSSPVPRWATSNPASGSLVLRPDDRDFEQFMTAVGREFGSQVSLFAIWNEPNHREFLQPQWNPNGTPASPRIYRGLYEAGYAGLQAAGLANPSVLMGETAPNGETHVTRPVRQYEESIAPLTFLRDMLCLNSSYHRSGACGELKASGFSNHPYSNTSNGPFYVPRSPETVTIGVLSRLQRALDLAARAHAIPAGLPIYITEFGVMSKPNRFQGVSAAQQAEYDAISERIAYDDPRVASFAQYLLKDDPLSGTAASGKDGFQTGLEYVNGTPKPLYSAFPIPISVFRQGSGYSLWGLVRPAMEPTAVEIQFRPPGSSRFRALAIVNTNALGYWTLSSRVRASQWRVRWVSPSGVLYAGPPVRAY